MNYLYTNTVISTKEEEECSFLSLHLPIKLFIEKTGPEY